MKKTIVLCVASFLVGAGASFLITRKLLEKKYADIAEAEITSVKEAFERRLQRESIVPEKKIKKKLTESEKGIELGKKAVEGIQKGLKNANATLTRSSLDTDPYEKAKREYHKMYKETPPVIDEKVEAGKDEHDIDPDEEDDTDAEELLDDAGMSEQDMLDLTKVDRTQPYVINDREFSEEFSHHDKVSLYYYRVDDVLTEENEDIIDNIEEVVGYDAIKVLDTQTNVWVRNEPLAIDYEIMALNSSFQEMVLGNHVKQRKVTGNMTPRERYEEKQKRREHDGE